MVEFQMCIPCSRGDRICDCWEEVEPTPTGSAPDDQPSAQTGALIARLEAALTLALDMLGDYEPGDSRAISDEYVAMSAVLCGVEPNSPGEEMAIIIAALCRRDNPNVDALSAALLRATGSPR